MTSLRESHGEPPANQTDMIQFSDSRKGTSPGLSIETVKLLLDRTGVVSIDGSRPFFPCSRT